MQIRHRLEGQPYPHTNRKPPGVKSGGLAGQVTLGYKSTAPSTVLEPG